MAASSGTTMDNSRLSRFDGNAWDSCIALAYQLGLDLGALEAAGSAL